MRVGVDIPYLTSAHDVRRYVQAMEELGVDHLGFSEHVCSTVDSQFPAPFFTFEEPWRETVTMATFVIAATQRVEVNPAMMLVPLYHPVLAAKQLAEISVLSEGRLRVAASIGWNHREAESLGVDPATRGARFEEQIEVMRRLWSEPVVDHAGRFFELRQVGISPRPASVIPLWMGAGRIDQGGFPSPFAVRRAARIADGFKFAGADVPRSRSGRASRRRPADRGRRGRSRPRAVRDRGADDRPRDHAAGVARRGRNGRRTSA